MPRGGPRGLVAASQAAADQALGDSEPSVVASAVRYLAEAGRSEVDATRALPVLQALLDDADEGVRCSAATAIGIYGC